MNEIVNRLHRLLRAQHPDVLAKLEAFPWGCGCRNRRRLCGAVLGRFRGEAESFVSDHVCGCRCGDCWLPVCPFCFEEVGGIL